ncbi:aspartyl-phosphate phosphatase Spo0E family protein [Radiobacillus kanasensis]|uniref:aspartyl-phosphate phosphatase Spo0E family protein n=1 Tax=Radiobacillus kanasensis TaxID=2844358 RepID=UPI001E286BCB|nr:aspartyl-phosphate phosphatase Spo0E family protein [Radiobacillus kanasensis]UFT99965.1 aspartyl-phosphate phosphatase Spo0E family protein [Radiobacillus kanasensis]
MDLAKRTYAEEELLYHIELLKSDMIKCGMDLGLDHPLTISLSQELDKLILDFQMRSR